MTIQQAIKVLADLAMEADLIDPIDFGMLEIEERLVFELMAAHVLELNSEPTVDKAIIVKLLVENFVLNARLMQ